MMPVESLKSLLGKFPYFFTRDPESNFVRSQRVTNNRFKDVYISLRDTYLSFALEKKILIWKEQVEAYNYTMQFRSSIPLLDTVQVFRDDDLIYEAKYELSDDGLVSYLVEEKSHTYTLVEETVDDEYSSHIDHTIYTTTHSTDEKISSFEYSHSATSENVIPTEGYVVTVTTFDEYTTSKGFPENDVSVGDVYDHDVSLDEIGALNKVPRKRYIRSTNFARTEPTYNDRLTEDDYHYMQRMLQYSVLVHSEPLVVAEIFKLYGLNAELINRDRFLCRMFDIFKHPYHYEPDGDGDRLFVDDWVPEPWEHKDSLCSGNIFMGEFFYVFPSTTRPVKKESVTFCFAFLNGLFENLVGDDFTVDVYLNGTEYLLDYTGECLLIPAGVLSDSGDNLFCFTGKQAGRLIGEWCENIHVRGCDDADWFVKSTGDDSSNNGKSINSPFLSVNKALTAVNGIYNLIGVFGTNSYNGKGFVHEDTYLVGCTTGILNNFTQPVFWTLDKGTSLRVIDLTCRLRDGSVNLAMGSAHVDYDIFINESCENTTDTTPSKALMYNLNYGVLISDFPDDVSFIKELDFDTVTGVLSWTEYDLSEFTKYSDFTGVDYDMTLEPDDDVYYWEFEPSKNETKLLNRPFVYLEDRKCLAEAMQTMTYDNSTGVLCLDLNGDEIIWEPKSHSI